jgi:hypothetical protein
VLSFGRFRRLGTSVWPPLTAVGGMPTVALSDRSVNTCGDFMHSAVLDTVRAAQR